MKSRQFTASLIVTASIFAVTALVGRTGPIHPDIAGWYRVF